MPANRRTPPRGQGRRGAAGRPSSSRGSSRPGRRSTPARSRTRTGAAQRPPRARPTGRAAILVLVLAVLAVSYASSLRAYLEQRSHIEALRESIAESRENIAALKDEKRRWRDPAYLEAQARKRFGYVMPGEVGFQVIDENGEPLNSGESLSDPDAVTEANRPEWWQTAWATVQAAGNPDEVEVPTGQIGKIKQGKEQARERSDP